MSRLWCFLLIITLCVGLNNAGVLEKNSVHFKNSLGPNNILRVDCSSKDDFLGVHDLKPGQTFDFSFNDSILKTKFDCTLAQGQGFIHQASFRAYEGGGFIVHYGKENFWDAREDGIYFTHGKETPKLEYKWS
ncbi:hypothetical protein BRARA_D02370 [Brassica rapa]|uniref:S-protein homolog n=1 Tax=Brassica campestris TaxID=3711 RepID=A0A397ZP57_BRACM|nr:S-protein homolog 9-like [Brassica rapa]RID67281.1 hypothetical protein BRARA_D02370 [Brassica rapa]CAG7908182.1 unnamed protein product [Brassica rapa]VDD15401.1 unnamed protein product [Brassica rapa]